MAKRKPKRPDKTSPPRKGVRSIGQIVWRISNRPVFGPNSHPGTRPAGDRSEDRPASKELLRGLNQKIETAISLAEFFRPYLDRNELPEERYTRQAIYCARLLEAELESELQRPQWDALCMAFPDGVTLDGNQFESHHFAAATICLQAFSWFQDIAADCQYRPLPDCQVEWLLKELPAGWKETIQNLRPDGSPLITLSDGLPHLSRMLAPELRLALRSAIADPPEESTNAIPGISADELNEARKLFQQSSKTPRKAVMDRLGIGAKKASAILSIMRNEGLCTSKPRTGK